MLFPQFSSSLPTFFISASPAGHQCNCICEYCFSNQKGNLNPVETFRMSDEILESYIQQSIETQRVPRISFNWQGGEPTLMGLDFFRIATAVQRKFARPGMIIENTIQTNGILIDEKWCEFFREHGFFVNLSFDGPKYLHDIFRKDKNGNSTFEKVLNASRLLQRFRVDFGVVCKVNRVNSMFPLEVYQFFHDELKAHFVKFVPVVESINFNDNFGNRVTEYSVQPDQYGRFLIAVFDEWIRNDVGHVSVEIFDAILTSYISGAANICRLQSKCERGILLDYNGDLYCCNQYVEQNFFLGNILRKPLEKLLSSEKQKKFCTEKNDSLPIICKECEFLFTCFGECPKTRFLPSSDESGKLSWLCSGLKTFYIHSRSAMKQMVNLHKRDLPLERVIKMQVSNTL